MADARRLPIQQKTRIARLNNRYNREDWVNREGRDGIFVFGCASWSKKRIVSLVKAGISLAFRLIFLSLEDSIMAKLSWIQRTYWKNLSKPVQSRPLFHFLLDHSIGSILEIGIGNGNRIEQILSMFTLRDGSSQLRYAGVDLFESSTTDGGHMRLKDAHRMLAEKNVRAHLVPGDATSALRRIVHSTLPSDLIIVDEGWGDDSLIGNALVEWLPKLVHDDTVVFARRNPRDAFQIVSITPIQAGRKAA